MTGGDFFDDFFCPQTAKNQKKKAEIWRLRVGKSKRILPTANYY